MATSTILITGASRGIGLGLVKQLLSTGNTVVAAVRSPNTATELEDLRSDRLHVVHCDVTDLESISAAASQVDKVVPQGLDILINNAGIILSHGSAFEDVDASDFNKTFDANVVGILNVTRAFLPSLEKRQRRLVVNLSSMAGSLELVSQYKPRPATASYMVSKAALNMLSTIFSYHYEDKGFIFIAIHPGIVKTDMARQRGQITIEESAEGILQVIGGCTTESNGKFYNYKGQLLPW